MFQPINRLHHFLKVPCPAGKIFIIQAIGETINNAQRIGILMKAEISAVRMLKRYVNIKIILKIRVASVPNTAASSAAPGEIEAVIPSWLGNNLDGLRSCPNRLAMSPIAVRNVLLNT